MAILSHKTRLFFSLVFVSLCFFQPASSSSLSTVAISKTSNQTLVCALISSPSSPQQSSSLNCTSFPQGIQIPFNPSLSLNGIVGGNGFLCGLTSSDTPSSSTSIMVCWRFTNNGANLSFKRIYIGPLLTNLDSGNSHICGIVNGTNTLHCWQWHEFSSSNSSLITSNLAVGEDFVCGLLPSGQIQCLGSFRNVVDAVPSGNNYSEISAGSEHACAISKNGSLACWGNMVGVNPIDDRFKSLALGDTRSCGLRINGTVFCWGENGFSLPSSLSETVFVTLVAKQDIFCGIVNSSLSLFCWGNDMFDSNPAVFTGVQVVPGPCTASCPCSPLPNSDRFCGQGLMICQHCVWPEFSDDPPIINGSGPSPPPLSPQPTPSQSTGTSDLWSRRNVAFLVVGCVGSLMILSVLVILFLKYCKIRGCRVHDSGRLDEAGTPPEQGSQTSQVQVQLDPQPQVLEKRLSQLISMGNGGHLEEFSLQVLLQVTNNFSEEHKIGTGSFGSVYRATLEDGREVAIKRAEASASSSYAGGSKYRQEEDKDSAFFNELEFLSRLNHKNLVRLLGYCEDSNERVLVFEYMNNGTLHDHLHRLESSPLISWTARIKVALDAARGVEYLHEYAVPTVIHRDIKSSNILLDTNLNAKVSDFGLSLMGPQDDETHLSLRAAGTVGYMDPEYYRLQQLTTKSDVYSFGVMMLELLSGYKAIHRNENGMPRNVVDFVVPYIVQDEIHRVLDRRVPPPTPFEIEAVSYVGYLAADCTTLQGRDRPTMTEIVNNLERALQACLATPNFSRSNTDSST